MSDTAPQPAFMDEAPARRPWVPHRPEQRLSVHLSRFLYRRALEV